MYDRLTLGLEESMCGLHAALEEAAKDGLPVAIAIVDHRGTLVCYAAEDRVLESSKTLCIRKAATAALGRSNSSAYIPKMRERLQSVPVELVFGTHMSSVPGGVVIMRSKDQLVLGGIGVSGGKSQARDEEIGAVGVRAMEIE